jgi:hypothetical protein
MQRLFLLASGTFAADLRGRTGDGEIGVGHAHHLVGNAVRLMLKRIVGRSNGELRLYDTWPRGCGWWG